MKIELRNSQRGTITKYTAEIYVEGEHAGYVQKGRYDDGYTAFADGLRIASARKLADVKADIREYFEGRSQDEPDTLD